MSLDPILALDGRVGRLRYLGFFIGATAVFYLLAFGFGWVIDEPFGAKLEATSLPGVLLFVGLLIEACVGIVLFFVSISFATRRFHDMNLSGNWNWLIVLLPFVRLPIAFVLPIPILIWHAVLMLVPRHAGPQ